MLLSEHEERQRRFKLALRAAIPILVLTSLVLYTLFFNQGSITLTPLIVALLTGVTFVAVYFIYFLIDLSVKESLIDQTTQGFNTRSFVKKLQRYKGEPKTLVLLIIRNLSTINEHYSVEEVDQLLYDIVHKLDATFREHHFHNALIARRYGAEFLVALPQKDCNIDKLLKTFIQKHRKVNQIEIDYAYAAICNVSNEIEKDVRFLKNSISMQEKYTSNDVPSTLIDAKQLSEIEHDVIKALEHKQLELSFRPLLETSSNCVKIYEAAVKLKSPSQGHIAPRVYLPIINRLGKGRLYDTILFEHILSLLPLIDDDIAISFNLSPFSLRDESFQDNFFKKLQQSNIHPQRLIIELYERKTHHNLSGYLKTLEQFRINGVRIAIDNFGSSNASMEYMKHFRFDMVQFDRDYVTKLEEPNTQAMLHSLIQMAKELHITTIAKWVDNNKQKQQLISLGIDYLQGFGIGKIITEQQLIQQYNQRKDP